MIQPDTLSYERLKQFFIEIEKRWHDLPKTSSEKELDKLIMEFNEEDNDDIGTINYSSFINTVQTRRNAIHAFKNREIGDTSEYQDHLKKYQEFLEYLNDTLPAPQDWY